MIPPPAAELRFGPFVLDRPGRRLLRAGEPLRLGHRALDILLALLDRPGEVVEKAELTARAWPGLHVDEANLRSQMAALRRVLGDGVAGARYIVNIAGRGYSFVAPLEGAAAVPPAAPRRPVPLPVRLTPLLGQAETVTDLAAQLQAQRFVSIIGAGGIGKTSVALAVAQAAAPSFAEGACFVDFGVLADPRLAVGHVAAALDALAEIGGRLPALAEYLRERQVLILFDSCETVVEQAAVIAEAILKAAPRVAVLATSRERLRAEGEWTHRLASMRTAPPQARLSAAEALDYPAIQLFVERARAADDRFRLRDEDVPRIAAICYRLEGIPLAIELAAVRATQLGIAALAAGLDARFALLMQGRRTALPRHQTLRATLDWSYRLLTPSQQAVLCRLAVFRGCFSHAAAVAVGGAGKAEAETIGILAELADKSLLFIDPGAPGLFYRCLDTTQAYLAEKLAERGEAAAAAAAHAAYFLGVFQAAEAIWAAGDAPAARRQLGCHLDNLRAALDCGFGPGGDAATAIALTIAAIPLWRYLYLPAEGGARVQAALAALDAMPAPDPRLRLHLLAGRGAMAAELALPEQEAVWTELLALAEQLGDIEHRLRALAGLFLVCLARSFREAATLAQRYRAIAGAHGLRAEMGKGERMIAYTDHMLGNQVAARQRLEAMLRDYPRPADRRHLQRFAFDEHILAMACLGQVLWVLGEPQRALHQVAEALHAARALDHHQSLFYVIQFAAGPVAMHLGGLDLLPGLRELLESPPGRVPPRLFWLQCFRGMELAARGDARAGLALLREGLGAMVPAAFGRRFPLFQAVIAECLITLGQPAEALAVAEAALELSSQREEFWFHPELLRLRGLALEAASPGSAAAEAAFREAIALAQTQAALVWELRACTSLARLLQGQGRGVEAAALLAAALGRFRPGVGSPDLDQARRLAAQLPSPAQGAEPRPARETKPSPAAPRRTASLRHDPG